MPSVKFFSKYFKALISVSYAFTIGVFDVKCRRFIYRTCLHFGWKVLQVEPTLPQVTADSIFSGSPDIVLSEPSFESGNTSLLELALICALVARKNPKEIFEIGTFDGRTALHMALNSNKECRIVTLDLPADALSTTTYAVEEHEKSFIEKKVSGERFRNSGEAARISQVYGDSAKFDYNPYLGRMDIVFVDASHQYDYVLNDSAAARKLLAPGGVILWHDYANDDWPGVTKALNELSADPFFRNVRWIANSTLVLLDTDASSPTK